MTDLVWLWVVYRVDSDAVFGAIRRVGRLYRTAEEARNVVGRIADRMGTDKIRWDQTDDATQPVMNGLRPQPTVWFRE
jgi:hypothetical protein